MENKTNTELMDFDLENREHIKVLEEKFAQNSLFFKPENGITYKIMLTSSKLPVIEKIYESGETGIKYVASITAETKDQKKFEGTWEVGNSVANAFVKGYKENGLAAVYKITKSGAGLETRYAVVVDF